MIKYMHGLHYAAFSLLLLLSGCSCLKKDSGTGPVAASTSEEVLISVSGKPVLTLKEFQQFMTEAISSDQQMQFMAQMMPDFEEQVFDRAKVREVVIAEWAKRTNAAEKAEYKKQREQAEKALAMMLNHQAFLREHVAEVTESDAQKYYNENKDKDQSLLQSAEGTVAKGRSFTSQQEAQDFLGKVHALNGDIEKAAKEIKKDLEDFGIVNKNSFLDKTVKTKILEVKKYPTILPVVKANDKEFWVVKVFSHENAKYRSFDEAKEAIKETLKSRKTEEVVDKKLAEYQKEYGITINKTYFERKKKEQQEKLAQQEKASVTDKKAVAA